MDSEMLNIIQAYKLPDVEVKTELEEASRSTESPKLASDSERPVQKPPNKRKKTPEKLVIKKPREDVCYDSDSEAEENYIPLSDVPKNVESKDAEECDIGEEVDKETQELPVVDSNADEDKVAVRKLIEEKFNGKKLSTKSPGNDTEFRDDTSVNTEASFHGLIVPDDVSETDPLGTCGLKLEFLESLGITPPIGRWVLVTNFRCDKFELRDVMELAGQVLSCSVVAIHKRYAKVQYSHPLEAVQAVSMLNGQVYFGLKLKVILEKNSKNDIILPKGLVNIGLGLGLQGRPVRDIVSQYQRYSVQQKSLINPILFRKINSGFTNYNDDEEKTNDSQMDVEEFVASSRTSTFANDRPFKIKHVEDLDSNDEGKEKSMKRLSSPESHSEKSLDSPGSNHGMRDDKPNNLKVNSGPSFPTLPDVPGNTALPLSLSRGHTGPSFPPRPNIPQNRPSRPQMSPAVPYRPCPQLEQANVPYTGPFKPGPFCNAVPNHVPDNVMNQPGQAPPPAPYAPMPNQGPSGPVQRPGPVQIPPPGPAQRPVNFSGLVPVSGPGPSPTAIHIPGPAQVPVSGQPIAAGPIHRPGPIPGQIIAPGQGPFPGSVPIHAPQSGPGPVHGMQSGAAPVHGIQQGPGIVNRQPALPAPGAPVPAPKTPLLQFANLPPNTTFPFLCEKLTQFGQVLSLQFTTPGCAVATFSHPAHAERCFHAYNGMTVEGYRISVKLG